MNFALFLRFIIFAIFLVMRDQATIVLNAHCYLQCQQLPKHWGTQIKDQCQCLWICPGKIHQQNTTQKLDEGTDKWSYVSEYWSGKKCFKCRLNVTVESPERLLFHPKLCSPRCLLPGIADRNFFLCNQCTHFFVENSKKVWWCR